MVEQVKGLDRLLRQLAAMPKAVREEMEYALNESAAEMAGAIRRAASFDPKLARTVDYRAGPAPGSAIFRTGAGDERYATALGERGLYYSVYAGDSEVFYARWTEFGTAPHAITRGADVGKRQSGVWHPGARANPFFWPTVRLYRKTLKSRVIRAGRKAAKAAAAVS